MHVAAWCPMMMGVVLTDLVIRFRNLAPPDRNVHGIPPAELVLPLLGIKPTQAGPCCVHHHLLAGLPLHHLHCKPIHSSQIEPPRSTSCSPCHLAVHLSITCIPNLHVVQLISSPRVPPHRPNINHTVSILCEVLLCLSPAGLHLHCLCWTDKISASKSLMQGCRHCNCQAWLPECLLCLSAHFVPACFYKVLCH